MKCPKCKSENVKIEIVQMGEVTKKHGNGLGGNMNNAARGITALCTFGMSNLVWKKSTGSEKTTAKNAKVAVCQDCGHSCQVGLRQTFLAEASGEQNLDHVCLLRDIIYQMSLYLVLFLIENNRTRYFISVCDIQKPEL